MISALLISKGRVQGVGYRAFVLHIAVKNGITGYVKNLSDGSVETLAYVKDEAHLKKFISLISPNSRNAFGYGIDVDEIKIIEKLEIEEKDAVKGFRIAY